MGIGRTTVAPVVVLITTIIFASSFVTAYAEITYSSINHRVNGPPSYCYVEPTDSEVSDIQKIEWGNEVEKSVKEWSDKLQASESVNNYLWEMKYLGSGDGPLPSCDYPIYFQPWPDQSNDWFRVAGHFFQERLIKIYFLGWTFCLDDDDGLIQCFDWSLILTGTQQGGTIKHEIGHSFGLDHYFTDSPDLQKKWEDLSTLPSVMISGINNNGNVKQVTDVDIQKVRSLYGSDGFYGFSRLQPPKPPTPEPIPVPKVAPKIPTFPFERIDITSSIIEVDPYSTEMIKIIGDISEEEFLQGQRVYIILKKPDGSTETLKITPTRKGGHFETTLVFDNDSMRGFYEIWAIYMEERDRNMDIVFEVVTKGKKTTSPTELTKTITSSSIVSGIGEFDVSFSDNKYTFSGFLGGYNEYVRLIAENECPSKKEVHKQDYSLTSERKTEATFTIHQLSQGKPELCTIYLTMYNFDDQVLDQTTVNYKIQTSKKSEITQTTENQLYEQDQESIPFWIKEQAKWWVEGLISDNDFINAVEYMIKEGIIIIPTVESEETSGSTNDIPDWVKNTVNWWSLGEISDQEFVGALQYLIRQGIIVI